jgi:hypothetical protein
MISSSCALSLLGCRYMGMTKRRDVKTSMDNTDLTCFCFEKYIIQIERYFVTVMFDWQV